MRGVRQNVIIWNILLVVWSSLGHVLAQGSSLDRVGTLWAPYLEWEVTNPTYSGNPFDLVATVTFTHSTSGATHTTEMFYDGGDTWKWRFTGTELGTWTFESTSADPELDGLSGTVTINPNPDPEAYGFITEYESATHTKWARYKGNDGEIEPFVPQWVMFEPRMYLWDEALIDSTIALFIGPDSQHGFTGFHVHAVGSRWFEGNEDNEWQTPVTSNDVNPNPVTFERLEMLINKVRAAGGVVHIWAWAETVKDISWDNLLGGYDGEVHNRLLRYIAARLGPVPGWSMGAGFDTYGWVSTEEATYWHEYLNMKWGWKHYLGVRGSKNTWTTDYDNLDYLAQEWFEPTYNEYVTHATLRPEMPSANTERFRIECEDGKCGDSNKHYTEDQTRRGLWHSTLAGGVANIWGRRIDQNGVKNSKATQRSYPYLNPHWIKTYATFWQGRFLKDMEPCNDLTSGYCLGDASLDSYVFYGENIDQLEVDLSGIDGTLDAVFVDTKAPYNEVATCRMTAGTYTWHLPYKSDWAVALGSFGQGASGGSGSTQCDLLPVELTTFEAVLNGNDIVLLWTTASETNNAGFDIQHKPADQDTWETIGFVEGKGTTTQPQTYSYQIEDVLPGRYQYRLKQVDFDGSFAFSPVVEIILAAGLEDATGPEVDHHLSEVYPNPFDNQAAVRLMVSREQPVRVTLHDVLGREVHVVFEGVVASNTPMVFPVEGARLPAGLYVLRVKGERFLDSRMLVRSH